MRQSRWLFATLALPLLLTTLPGCGGGSGGGLTSTSTSTGRSAPLEVYITDAFSDQYKQVLVTLYKIELSTDGTNYTTVYTSDAGQTVDFSALSSTAQLLSTVNVPTGTYTSARVTFGDHITLVAQDGTSASTAVDPTLGTDANSQIAIVVPTPTKVQAGQTATVLVDFKLAEFKLVGSVLRPQIGCGDGSAIGTKARGGHLMGTVANLNGTTGFTLQGPNGKTITVALASTTTITSGQTGSAITLANGQSVTVDGSFDASTQTLTATSVVLNDYTTIPHAQARGTVASVNTTNNSFTLTITQADHFQPTGGTITVTTSSTTRFPNGRQSQGTFANVTVGSAIGVQGTFDTPSQTLAAGAVLLKQDMPGHGPGGPGDGGPGSAGASSSNNL